LLLTSRLPVAALLDRGVHSGRSLVAYPAPVANPGHLRKALHPGHAVVGNEGDGARGWQESELRGMGKAGRMSAGCPEGPGGEKQWWWGRLRRPRWGTLTVWEARGRGRCRVVRGSGKRGGEWGGKTV